MEATEILKTVIAANKAVVARAKELNGRAGEKLFPVPTRDELTTWLLERLQGARSASKVKNRQLIMIPELDQEMVELVLRENPDTMELLGEQVGVVYLNQYAQSYTLPVVTLQLTSGTDTRWLALPDGGVKLPGGRTVQVKVMRDYSTLASDHDIPKLKAQILEEMNRTQWERWIQPQITLPELTDDNAVIPFETAQYGTCAVTGKPLMAYGTVRLHMYAGYSGYPSFVVFWDRDQTLVQQKADEAAAHLAKKREEAKAAAEREVREAAEKVELERIVEESKVLKDELEARMGADYNDWLSMRNGLSNQIYSHVNTYWYSATDSLVRMNTWISEALALKAKAQTDLANIRQEREEKERKMAEMEARDRAELAPILEVVGEDCLSWARDIKMFAQDVERIVGRRWAINGLRQEFEAHYGYANRQAAIRSGVNGIEDTDGGARFLSLYRLRDVESMLEGAIAWLEAQSGSSKAATASTTSVPSVPVVDSPKVDVAALDLGGLFAGRARTSGKKGR